VSVDRLAMFMAKVMPEPMSGCWLWIGALNGKGYGNFRGESLRTLQAHKFSYETFVGDVPPGLQLDHKCRTPACVNPEHLEPVTSAENTRRGSALARRRAVMAGQTHCKRGHELDPTYVSARKGVRAGKCATCLKENGKKANLRRLMVRRKRKIAHALAR